ncbi:hypothetical protein, partial [Paraprevotella clara]
LFAVPVIRQGRLSLGKRAIPSAWGIFVCMRAEAPRKPDIKLFGRFLLRLLAETFRPFLLFLFPYPLAVLEAVHSSAVFGRQSGSPVVALCR